MRPILSGMSIPHAGTRLSRWAASGSLASRVLAAQVGLLLVALIPLGFAAVQNTRQAERQRAIDVATAVSVSLASSPWVAEAVTGPDPVGALGDAVETIRLGADVDFIVVMAPDGTRFTHPDPEQVGGTYIGSIAEALAGGLIVEDATGTLGDSVRVVAPVYATADDGAASSPAVVALVSTGVVLREVSGRVAHAVTQILLIGAVGLALAVVAALWLARTVRRQTFGLGALGLARLHSYQDAMIGSVPSGLVLMAEDATVVLINQQALDLLELGPVEAGTPVVELRLDADLAALLASGRPAQNEQFATHGRTLVVTQVDAHADGGRLGWVATLADRTELARASGELDNLRIFTESLRARSHEADNRLHTVAMLVELGEYEEAVEFATAATRASQALTDKVVARVDDSAVAALVLGKSAQGTERGVSLEVETLDVPRGALPTQDLVTILGNLLDNALDAAAAGEAPRWVRLSGTRRPDALVIEVWDSGGGVPIELRSRVFERGFSTKPEAIERPHGRGIGLALVDQTVRRLGGTIAVVSDDASSRFRVEVPLPTGPSPSAECDPNEPQEVPE